MLRMRPRAGRPIGESVRSVYDSYRAHRVAGASPSAAAQMTARDYGRVTQVEVQQIEAAMAALEQRDGSPQGAPSDRSQSTERTLR